MGFPLSPSVTVVEKDFSAIVPAVSTSAGAFAGAFEWGPVLDPVTVTSESVLTNRFGLPRDGNFQSFFTASNFLSYSNNLLVVRSDAPNLRNAVSVQTGSVTSFVINNAGSGYTSVPTVTVSAPQDAGGTTAAGTAVLSGGTVTDVVINNKGSGYTSATATFSAPDVLGGTTAAGTAVLSGSVSVSGGSITVNNAGTGYTSANVTFSAPEIAGGVTATGSVTLSAGGVASVTVTNGGSGYLAAPTATISGNGTGATVSVATFVLSRVEDVTITNPGSGYLNAPTVTITGTGTGATGTTTVSSSTITGITITNPGSGYTSTPTVTITGGGGSGATATTTTNVGGVKIRNLHEYQTYYQDGEGVVGEFVAKYPGKLGNSLTISVADSNTFATWAYNYLFDSAPGTSSFAASTSSTNDELHVVVVDTLGAWTGTPGTVLEKFAFLSKASNAKKSDGTNNYYKDALNSQSKYIWWTDHPAGTNWGTAASGTTYNSLGAALTRTLAGGVDDFATTDGNLEDAFAIFANDELYDISLIPTGKVSSVVANFVISNVAEVRRDCVAFISPVNVSAGEVIIGSGSDAVNAVNDFRNALPSTSYAFLDSGFKYQYDRYNDKYRWVPLNGDVAGLTARTDYTNDAWWSPAGMNRGQIKNVIKLSLNPGKTERDNLYKNGVNPVVTMPGQGTVLFGDKTLLAKPSAFDRINVRRLFIVLEKAISTAAKFQLFEFNDSFTRAQFKNMIEPFLRDVQGRRGLIDFRVKCDETNNTGEVIDRNEFVADIYLKPARSINFISLNFIAARTSASFSELGA